MAPRRKKVTAPKRKASTRKTSRRKFATMTCPIKGCTHWLSERPGTVPGVKRHVRALHPDAFDKVKWPPTYADGSGRTIAQAIRKGSSVKKVKAGNLEKLSIVELREKAKAKGIKTSGLRKQELVSALS